MNFEDIKIPSNTDLEEIAGMLNAQIREMLDTAVESDSLIAERLSTNQRWEVEDNAAGLSPEGYNGVIMKGVMLTDAPQAINPASLVLKSLKTKIDEAKKSGNLQNAANPHGNLDHQSYVSNEDVSQSDAGKGRSGVPRISSEKSNTRHRVYMRDSLLNEYSDNPELIGGAFADLLPLGFTKDEIGSGGTLPPKMVKTWFLSRCRRFVEHRAFNHFFLTKRLDTIQT